MLLTNTDIQAELSSITRAMGQYAKNKATELRERNYADSTLFYKEMAKLLDAWLYEKLYPLNRDIGYSGKTFSEGNQDVRWVTSLWTGSNTFFRDGYLWAVHFGLESQDNYRIACMYLPVLDELFYAETGKGTQKNGRRVFPRTDFPLHKSTGGVGFSCVREGLEDTCVPIFDRLLPKVGFMNILPIGSSSCKIVDGTFDFMFEKELSFNQIYSASVIVEEAGGSVTDFQGNRVIDPSNILFCSHRGLVDSLLPYLSRPDNVH